jgi:hypothetical protein
MTPYVQLTTSGISLGGLDSKTPTIIELARVPVHWPEGHLAD